jgi:hypothetical protein
LGIFGFFLNSVLKSDQAQKGVRFLFLVCFLSNLYQRRTLFTKKLRRAIVHFFFRLKSKLKEVIFNPTNGYSETSKEFSSLKTESFEDPKTNGLLIIDGPLQESFVELKKKRLR